MSYIGRFAPSPTGPLHIGSLLSALLGYWDAKAHQGSWLLRIEDVDQTRSKAHFAQQICRTLQRFNLHWDGPILYQSSRQQAYQAALEQLDACCYPCSCSRKSWGQQGIYPGYCRLEPQNPEAPFFATRICLPKTIQTFTDRYQGIQHFKLSQAFGDVVLRRKDGFYAYHLAVTVDDAKQQITHVVRGQDLFAQTAIQVYLQQLLQYQTPQYCHCPLIVHPSGNKLSKSQRAASIEHEDGVSVLRALYKALGLPKLEHGISIKAALAIGIEYWSLQASDVLARSQLFTDVNGRLSQ